MRFRVTLEDLTSRKNCDYPPKVEVWDRDVAPDAGGFIETASDCTRRYGSGGTYTTEDCRGPIGYQILKVEPVAQEAGFLDSPAAKASSSSAASTGTSSVQEKIPGMVYQIPRGA